RKGVPRTKTDGVPLFGISLATEEILREEPELQIAFFGISVTIFSLQARLGRDFQLDKSVGDVIALVSVAAKPVCPKVEPPKAEGRVFVDASDDSFACIGAIFPTKAAGLQR